jgi:alpha-N-acetylglucosamine transferase
MKKSDVGKTNDDKVSSNPWVAANAKNLSISHLRLDKKPEDLTALVTFAGMKKTEYLDGAVMLAHSLKKHAPGYPLVAIAIDGMKPEHQKQLENAGWQLVFVDNWEDEYCQQDCNQEFMKRWHDSFEKINIFRLGFGKVLFFDADTYVFSPRVKQLLTATRLKKDHIAMAPDGCKDEYNSGVMLFRPSVGIFRKMLEHVVTHKREQILDQNVINAAYAGKIMELDREFNCVDIMGVQPGM